MTSLSYKDWRSSSFLNESTSQPPRVGLSSTTVAPLGTSFTRQAKHVSFAHGDSFYADEMSRQLNDSLARERLSRSIERSTRDRLSESLAAEEEARTHSVHLRRELGHVKDALNRSQREEEGLRDKLDHSISHLEHKVDQTELRASRIGKQVELKAEEAENTRRLLDMTMKDLRRRDSDLNARDEHNRRLEYDLRFRQDQVADLKLTVENCKRTISERDEHIRELKRVLRDTEEKLNMRTAQLRETEASLADSRSKNDALAEDFQFEKKRNQQKVHAIQHDLEAAREAIASRDKEILFFRTKIEDLERGLLNHRREIELRDERLDKRQAEVQQWASECDRLRTLLEQARQRYNDTLKDNEARMKENTAQQQELYSKISAVEVQRDVAVAAKTDLIQTVSRMQHDIGDLEEQVRELKRTLEGKEQKLAELAVAQPRAGRKKSVRRTGGATTTTTSYSASSKWRY